MSDIFREVDEDVRRDQAAQIWARYQNLFIGLAVLVIAATAGWRFYDHYRTKQSEEAGAKYEAALALARDGKAAEAEGAFEQIAQSPLTARSIRSSKTSPGCAPLCCGSMRRTRRKSKGGWRR
jgi:hypothetical protein